DQLLVAHVLDEFEQLGVLAEEVPADVVAALDGVLLVLAVDDLAHALHEQAAPVAGQQLVPVGAPDDLDAVPARAAEGGLQLLDDLAVAADGAVETLQVAVDDEDQVVEPLAGGQGEGPQRLRLVALAVAHEAPDVLVALFFQAAVLQVAVEAGLVDG